MNLAEIRANERRRIIKAMQRGWRVDTEGADGQKLVHQLGLSVIWSIDVEPEDGRLWMHISAARQDRIPSYLDMTAVKAWIAGDWRYAYTVHAPSSKHVNIHPNCLHLWVPLDQTELPLPDFSRGGVTI